MKLGSFFFPLIGTGERNGLSVSTNSLLFGIFKNVFKNNKLLVETDSPY